MTVLSAPDRNALQSAVQRMADCPGGISKSQLADVIAAMDDWWETAAANGNAAIPQPQRGILTQKQKAALFMLLLQKRYEVTP